MYELYLAVHILCAVLWVGGGVSVHILGRWVQKSGDPERIVAFNRDAVKLGNVFYAPLALVLIVAGVLLVEEVGYSYGDLWITLDFLGWPSASPRDSASTPSRHARSRSLSAPREWRPRRPRRASGASCSSTPSRSPCSSSW